MKKKKTTIFTLYALPTVIFLLNTTQKVIITCICTYCFLSKHVVFIMREIYSFKIQ